MVTPAAQKAAEALRQAPADKTPTSLPGFYHIWYTGIRAEALADLEAGAAQHPSHEAMEAAVCLEIQSAIGRVTTEAIGRLIDQAMFVRSTKP